MTFFNAAGVLMSLDEYSQKCVDAKPLRRSSYKTNRRQAGHLRSYKDLDFFQDEDEDDYDAVPTTGFKSLSLNKEVDPNMNQINFEMDEFNKIYSEETGSTPTVSSNPDQRRIQDNNARRPSDASTTGSDKNLRPNVKARLDLRAQSRSYFKKNQRKRNNQNWNQNNNGQHHRGQGGNRVQKPLVGQPLMEQRMRNAYNAFSNTPEQQNDIKTTNTNSIFSQVNSVSSFPYQPANNLEQSLIQPERSYGNGFNGPQHTPMPNNKNAVVGELIGISPFGPSNFNVEDVARNVLLLLSSVSSDEPQGQVQNSNWMGGNQYQGNDTSQLHRFN
ncbi:uncharacterized protein Dana_GF12711, isoform C [Drosophila ananassae]|uniref:Uncharacterized protein, isoform C n=1 Tax=Drosophila ananassae TaxID=7217 RepID=A0A0P8XMN2_DROAN|nr:GATA zinc finger domain-containing protein 14 isoform X1 [Drosophila ananassae]KPU75890.1 uncharacterized protein Dana_GF12711, isoform C [Drosophila ananassae]